MSFKPDQVRQPSPALLPQASSSRPLASRAMAHTPAADPNDASAPYDGSLPYNGSASHAGPAPRRGTGPQTSAERIRERYRKPGAAGRRPLFPDTRAGWALLIGLLLVPVFTATLLLTGRTAANPGTATNPSSSQGGLSAAAPSAAVSTSADPNSTPGPGASASSAAASSSADPGAGSSAGPSVDPNRDPTVPPANLTGYSWPLAVPMITLPFGPTEWGDFFYQGVRIHDGIDMASWCGDNVMAAHDGVVLATGTQYDAYMGWVESLKPYTDFFNRKHWWNSLPLTVVIDDGNGFRSVYAHESKITVKVGQHVKAGQLIGYEGATGNASGCHVHYGLFNPNETVWFSLDPGIVSRDFLPEHEVARVNALYVLPFRCEFEEMRALFPDKAAACPPLPSPTK